ncbi:MAG: NAD(P)H-dependent oxidoreductase subunit E [Vicinamibacterales bacterium]
MREVVREIVQRHLGERRQLLGVLREIQQRFRAVSDEAIALVAEEMDLPRVHVQGTATFYHFLSSEHRGAATIYLNTSATSEMAGCHEVARAFEEAAGTTFGHTTEDRALGLYTTSCIGMSDQEPAALVNDVVLTRLTPARARAIVNGLRSGRAPQDLVGPLGDGRNASPAIRAEVRNHLRQPGPVFFAPWEPGAALARALDGTSLEAIEVVRRSGLRGRGGAGFPTGAKWAYCRATDAESRYVICNLDEGEPGTFKDRVLATERADQVFEGMAVAAYAVEANRGLVYLRAEYAYLRRHLERVLHRMRERRHLGRRILDTPFSFDIRIRVGAGAYVCGEESALIESAEGRRGTPRNRPPFPVVSGYRRRPTIVNNPETFAAAARILVEGADWFRAMGTAASPGTKLLSVAGDCDRPGIYELPWGVTVREVLDRSGATDTLAVQVGGPSGTCVSPREFDRRLADDDLATGGAFTVFDRSRDLLSIVHNHMSFFASETCGFCVPCRAGTTLLLKSLEKVMVGNGTEADLEAIRQLGAMVRATSRCGLGQTAPNPLLTTLAHFPDEYLGRVRTDVDYVSQFNLEFASAASRAAAARRPNLQRG